MKKHCKQFITILLSILMITSGLVFKQPVINANATTLVGWNQNRGTWSYFKSDGTRQIGWLKVGGMWYLLNYKGDMVTGWAYVGGKWYYLNQNGAMQTGWKQVGTTWYLLNVNGDMATGWKQFGTTWYLLNANGDMAIGWKQLGTTWYYLYSSSGAMASNVTIGGYYLGNDGAMKDSEIATGSYIYGNTSANINNFGMAAYDGEFIYHNSSFAYKSIYRERSDGTGVLQVTQTAGSCINVVGDWVYYVSVMGDEGIYKVKKDGSSKTKLAEDKPFFISVVNDWIYYFAAKDGISLSLYKIKNDGSNKTELKFNVTDTSIVCIDEQLAVVGDWVYTELFRTSDHTHHFYRIKTNGSVTEKVLDTSFNRQFAISENYIYYINNYNEICKANSDGSNVTLLCKAIIQDSPFNSLNVANNNIYFSADSGIYKINLDGTGLTKLTSTYCTSFCIVADWIYFDGGTGKTKKIKIDGSNEIEVQ